MTILGVESEGSFSRYVCSERGRGYAESVRKCTRGEGVSSTNVRTLMQFSNDNYLRSILNRYNYLLKSIHASSQSHSCLEKYLIILGVRSSK